MESFLELVLSKIRTMRLHAGKHAMRCHVSIVCPEQRTELQVCIGHILKTKQYLVQGRACTYGGAGKQLPLQLA